MKYLPFSFLFVSLLLISCGDDPVGPSGQLHFDGANVTAPFLQAGTHQACAKFSSSDLSSYDGQRITAIEAYFLNAPTLSSVNIYRGTANGIPDQELIQQDVTSQIEAESWNIFNIQSPPDIDGRDLWVCMEVFHTSNTNTIGCDGGPAANNGDWYNSISDNTWQSFRTQTNNEADINWNIRAVVSE